MKTFLATLFAAAMFSLSGCASPDSNAGSASAESSGVTVFGTVDGGMSSYRNQSR